MDYLFVDTARDTMRTGWAHRHNTAVDRFAERTGTVAPAEAAILGLVQAITRYAEFLGSPDGVLTPALMQMLNAFGTLLNGDLGRLDGGTLSTWAYDLAASMGWDLDIEDWA